jgi:hypothetical protein
MVGVVSLTASLLTLLFLYGICRYYARPSRAALAAVRWDTLALLLAGMAGCRFGAGFYTLGSCNAACLTSVLFRASSIVPEQKLSSRERFGRALQH